MARTRTDRGALPPGPRLPRLVQSSGVLRFRHRFVPWLHRRYGDVFTVRLLPADRTTVYFAHPDAHYFGVGKVERDQVEDYAARKGWSIAEAERWLAPNLAS